MSEGLENESFHHIYFRDIFGSELVYINLSMNNEDRNRRLMERHEGNEQVAKFLKVILLIQSHAAKLTYSYNNDNRTLWML